MPPGNPDTVYRAKRRRRGAGFSCCAGNVAAEFALVAPMLVLVAAGIGDFGMLAARSAVLVGTTRIGAEYARLHPADTTGIQSAMRSAMSFVPPLSFPASFPQSCECDDGTSIACSELCATAGRPSPNRLFIKITASQSFTPLVPWPGIPENLTATTEMRVR